MKEGSRTLFRPEEGRFPGVDRLLSMPRYATAGRIAIQPGLDRIRALLEHLGRPQDSFPVIHVAGTNGKGSTASFIASLLTASGLRCGLHTSPHLVFVGERMRVDGAPAPADWLNESMDALGEIIQKVQPSYFELTVALSLDFFASQRVGVAVVEVGLGGRLDATNVLDPDLSVITHIALDHTEILGETIEAIAHEKGGIIRSDVPVVCGEQAPAARDVLRRIAESKNAAFLEMSKLTTWNGTSLTTPSATYSELSMPMAGVHQYGNAATALLATECFLAGPKPDSRTSGLPMDAVRSGIRDVSQMSGLRGRYEVWSQEPLVVLDVGHNPDAVLPALRLFADQTAKGESRSVALAIMSDKALAPIAQELATLQLEVLPIQMASERALPASALARSMLDAGVEIVRSPISVRGLKRHVGALRGRQSLLIIGSSQLVGSFLEAEM